MTKHGITQHYSKALPINHELAKSFNKADDHKLKGETINHTQCVEVDLEKLGDAAAAAAKFLQS